MAPNLNTLIACNNYITTIIDLNFIDDLESLVEIDIRGNTACLVDEENFLKELLKEYGFLERVNGRQLQEPGTRYFK